MLNHSTISILPKCATQFNHFAPFRLTLWTEYGFVVWINFRFFLFRLCFRRWNRFVLLTSWWVHAIVICARKTFSENKTTEKTNKMKLKVITFIWTMAKVCNDAAKVDAEATMQTELLHAMTRLDKEFYVRQSNKQAKARCALYVCIRYICASKLIACEMHTPTSIIS